jgi:hypothetical protein
MRAWAWFAWPQLLMLASVACATGEDVGGGAAGAGGAGEPTPSEWPTPGAAGDAGASASPASDAQAPAPDDAAYLHADVWSVWWNDRTRCGAERAFLNICKARGGDCSTHQQAVDVCDPHQIVYGQVGPEKQGEELCQRGKFPDIGGCDATQFDFEKLRFWWYGAEWQGNWPFATLKLFHQGQDWKGGGEIVAYSSLPGAAQAAMAGTTNHGLGHGCAMLGKTSGDDKYRRPFGGFAWIEVPTDTVLTLAVAAGTNFADQPFQGCSRGSATQTPWIAGAPGAIYGCVYVLENLSFAKGKHYFWQFGKLVEVPGPPQAVIDGFALPEVGIDVQTKAPCTG